MPEISINFNINRLPVSFGRHRPPGPVSKVPAEDKFLNCPLGLPSLVVGFSRPVFYFQVI